MAQTAGHELGNRDAGVRPALPHAVRPPVVDRMKRESAIQIPRKRNSIEAHVEQCRTSVKVRVTGLRHDTRVSAHVT